MKNKKDKYRNNKDKHRYTARISIERTSINMDIQQGKTTRDDRNHFWYTAGINMGNNNDKRGYKQRINLGKTSNKPNKKSKHWDYNDQDAYGFFFILIVVRI